jgi:hypothetical protein
MIAAAPKIRRSPLRWIHSGDGGKRASFDPTSATVAQVRSGDAEWRDPSVVPSLGLIVLANLEGRTGRRDRTGSCHVVACTVSSSVINPFRLFVGMLFPTLTARVHASGPLRKRTMLVCSIEICPDRPVLPLRGCEETPDYLILRKYSANLNAPNKKSAGFTNIRQNLIRRTSSDLKGII